MANQASLLRDAILDSYCLLNEIDEDSAARDPSIRVDVEGDKIILGIFDSEGSTDFNVPFEGTASDCLVSLADSILDYLDQNRDDILADIATEFRNVKEELSAMIEDDSLPDDLDFESFFQDLIAEAQNAQRAMARSETADRLDKIVEQYDTLQEAIVDYKHSLKPVVAVEQSVSAS